LRLVSRGLAELPDSARLHYERALFLAQLDRLTEAKPEFARAAELARGSYLSYLAQVQEALYGDRYSEAIRLLREGIKVGNGTGNGDYQMLSLLGTVLLRQGAAPGTAEFAEAQSALEKSAAARPDYSATQIALGKLYLMAGRPSDAVEHLEIGRRLEPNNSEVYAGLSAAYLRLGERDKARECQTQLLRLSSEKKAGSTQANK
jgi:tetratricopeptide (TPR) repeat protein